MTPHKLNSTINPTIPVTEFRILPRPVMSILNQAWFWYISSSASVIKGTLTEQIQHLLKLLSKSSTQNILDIYLDRDSGPQIPKYRMPAKCTVSLLSPFKPLVLSRISQLLVLNQVYPTTLRNPTPRALDPFTRMLRLSWRSH